MFLFLPAALAFGVVQTPTPKPAPPSVSPPMKSTPVKPPVASAKAPTLYYQPEKYSSRYAVNGIFNGHFPPFSTPGAEPIHLRIVLEYSATVKKREKDSAEVAFHVEKADLFLLEAEPDKDGKLPPGKEEVAFPIPIEDVQKSLDVTANISDDGTVKSVSGGNENSAKINFGIELRKLFLLIYPVAFVEKQADGLLGKGAGVTYINKFPNAIAVVGETGKPSPLLASAPPKSASNLPGQKSQPKTVTPKASATLKVRHAALAKIDEMRDDKNQTTTELAKAAELSTGSAAISGDIVYSLVENNAYAKLSEAKFDFSAKVHQKKTHPDPAKPEEPSETDVDVTAKLTVKAVASPTPAKTK